MAEINQYNRRVMNISNEQLFLRYLQVSPIKNYDGKLYHIKKPPFEKIHNVAYLWDTKKFGRAIGKKRLTEVARVKTYHSSYGYYGFFKPDFAEVLSFLDDELVDKVNAVQLINATVLNAGYHTATAVFYWEKNV